MHDLCIFLICFCSKIIFDQNFFSVCWDKLDYPGSIAYLFLLLILIWLPGVHCILVSLFSNCSLVSFPLTHTIIGIKNFAKQNIVFDNGDRIQWLNFASKFKIFCDYQLENQVQIRSLEAREARHVFVLKLCALSHSSFISSYVVTLIPGLQGCSLFTQISTIFGLYQQGIYLDKAMA